MRARTGRGGAHLLRLERLQRFALKFVEVERFGVYKVIYASGSLVPTIVECSPSLLVEDLHCRRK